MVEGITVRLCSERGKGNKQADAKPGEVIKRL